ncbi:Sua5/YciO/YrdC/YwlC family protein [symbiont of Argiope bruennichi]|uniref:Sua5/YciO/YrdC/YwlC family protein n=1 Tax=symbiont of Argiope bruennichi TaxID=2810479 RepID=UPI003DA4F7C9
MAKICFTRNGFIIAQFDTVPSIFAKVSKKNFNKLNKIKETNQNFTIFFSCLEQLLDYFNLEEKQIKLICSLLKFNPSFKILKSRVKEEYKEILYSKNDYLFVRIWFSKKNSVFAREVPLLIDETGPLFATSCHYKGEDPRIKLRLIKQFFYQNLSKKTEMLYCRILIKRFSQNKISTIIDLENNNFLILRKGMNISEIINCCDNQ